MESDFLYSLQTVRESAPDFISAAFNGLSEIIAGPIAILVCAIVFWSVDRRAGYLFTSTFILSAALGQLVKNIACIYRPWITDPRLHVHPSAAADASGYSFPSIHTIAGTAFYGSLAKWQKKHRLLVAALVLMIAATAFSRLWLGCHSVKDVLAGVFIGCVVLFANARLVGWIERHPERDVMVTVAGVVAAVAYLLFITLKPYPMDFDASGALLVDPWAMQTDCFSMAGGMAALSISWFIEHRFVRFETGGLATRTRVLRAVVGSLAVLVVYLGVVPVAFGFLDDHWYHFAKYAVTVFVVVAVCPACFKALEKRRAARS